MVGLDVAQPRGERSLQHTILIGGEFSPCQRRREGMREYSAITRSALRGCKLETTFDGAS